MSTRARTRIAVPLLIGAFLVGIVGIRSVTANSSGQTLPFSQDWSNTGQLTPTPPNNWNGVPGIVGYQGANLTATVGVDPQTVLVDGDPPMVLANQTDPGSVLQGGVAEFEDGNPTIALQGTNTADAPNIVITLNTTGKSNVFVSYNLRDIDDSSDDAMTPVAAQWRLGTSGTFMNLPAGFVADATTGPNLATLVTPVEVGLPAAANDKAAVQVRIITTNSSGRNEWVGVDDISAIAAEDDPPDVQSTIPSSGATNVPIGSNLSVTFSEPVNLSGTWFIIDCATSGTHAATVSGGPTTFTLNPTTPFVHSENCTLRVRARSVTDQDAIDPPDRMPLDKTITFRTIPPDDAPTVTGIAPADGTTNVPVADNLAVAFSEPVDVAGGAFTLDCATSGPHALGVSGGPTAFTLDPATDLGFGESCTLTVHAAKVSDQDTNDPPDTLAADRSVSFTTVPPPDGAPTVTGTTPTNGATDVPVGTSLGVTFSEPVDVATGGFTVTCATSGDHTVAVSGGPSTFTIDPDVDFSNAESCTLTVHAAQVTDQDTNDPPDNMAADATASFTTVPLDDAPTVVSTDPADNATGVPVNGSASVTFSEPVEVADGGFTLTCATSGDHTVSVSGGPTTFTIVPDVDFANSERCTFNIHAALVSDQDANDPPDTMAADASASFTTADPAPVDAAPTVVSTSPADTATGVARAANVSVTFSEPVNVAPGWAGINCATSGAHPGVASGGPTTWTVNPNADFAYGETCTVTVTGANVTDQDAIDPPDAMTANMSFAFTTLDAPPPPNTPPTVNAGGPYQVDQGGTVQVSATGTDPENGALTYAWDLDNNGSFETTGQTATFSAAGLTAPLTRTIQVKATDPGGLTDTKSATVNVVWHNGGFDIPGGGNRPTFKAGANVPVKFSLGGNHGLDVLRPGYPASDAFTCGGTAPTNATGQIDWGGKLKYDPTTDTYSFNWKTDRAWANSCRVLVLGLKDGQNLSVTFEFK